MVVTAFAGGAGILPAVFKEGLLEAGPTLQRLSSQLPGRGLFFRTVLLKTITIFSNWHKYCLSH